MFDTGVRQFEFDIFADPQGGRYADPKGETWARAAGETTSFDRAAMLKPGFNVLHNPDDQPEGVIQIVQDPLVDGKKIKRWVKEGLIVRTRTDAGTQEARRKDFSKAMAQCNPVRMIDCDRYNFLHFRPIP